jgi:glutathione S-transferase
MSDLTLYWLIAKDRSSRIRWLLRELNVAFSEQQLNAAAGEHRKDDFLNLSPFGKVPTIVTNNLTISESGAIVLYLLDRYDTQYELAPGRDSDLWPGFLQWFFWSLVSLEGAVFAYTNNRKEKELANLGRFLAPFDQMLASKDYLVGETFTAADIMCAYNLGILSVGYDLDTYPSLQDYLSRLLARPAAASYAKAIGWP